MIHQTEAHFLPKTYTVSAPRYREGARWQTDYKGVRVEFCLGQVIRTNLVKGKSGNLYPHHVVEVVPC